MGRDHSIDNVGGVMIIYMMLHHCFVPPLLSSFIGGYLVYYPFLFFMAWFFFKGGMFYKEESVKTAFAKGFNRLIVPYLLYTAIAFIISLLILCCIEGTEAVPQLFRENWLHLKKEGAFECNAPLWFLPSLFAARLAFSICRNLKIPVPVVALLVLGFSFGIITRFPHLGFYFGNALLGLFFYSMGFILKEKQYENAFFYVSAALYLIILVYFYIDGNAAGEFNLNIHKPFLCVILFYLAGCITFDNLFRRVEAINCSFLETAGKKSMVLYVTHFLVIYNFIYLNSQIWHLSPWMLFGVLCVTLAITMPFVLKLSDNRYFKWTFGI